MNNLIENYVFSEAGKYFLKAFTKKFKSDFMSPEPDGPFTYCTQKRTFAIPENETVENFKNAVTESLKQNKDLLRKRYKGHEYIYYDEDWEY